MIITVTRLTDCFVGRTTAGKYVMPILLYAKVAIILRSLSMQLYAGYTETCILNSGECTDHDAELYLTLLVFEPSANIADGRMQKTACEYT